MESITDIITRLSSPLAPLPTGHPTRLTPVADIKAVIFDIYGTLLISGSGDVGPAAAKDDEQAFALAMHDARLQVPPGARGTAYLHQAIEEFQAQRREQGVVFPEIDILRVWARVLSSMGLPPPDPAQLETLALSYECRVNPVWPMPNMRSTLNTLRNAGLILGIVSNAQFYTPLLLQAFTGVAVDQLGFEHELCRWSYRELQGKPSSELFEQVLRPLQQRHHIAPQQTLYVGNDCLKDMWPAASLGMRTALFAGDQRSLRLREDDARCAGIRPDLIIDDLAQLPGVIGCTAA